MFRHCLVESCIKYGYLRNIRQKLLYGIDTLQVGRIVKRAEVTTFFNGTDYIIVDKYRSAEFSSSVKYAVSYCIDFIE